MEPFSFLRRLSILHVTILTVLVSCSSPVHSPEPDSALELRGMLRCFEGPREVTLSEALDDLAKADVVFVGELHDDALTHRAELAILEGLAARREVTLSLEMFERHEQAVLDRYLTGAIDEAEFRAGFDPWKNYTVGYRALIEFAKASRIPVVAANGPRTLLRRISRRKEDALEELTDEERTWVPRRVLPARDAYWTRYDRIARVHGGSAGPPTEERRFWVQNLWDNTMGESIVDTLRRDEGRCVVHVCGEFHSAFGEGTVHQVRLRAPQAKVRTISLRNTHDLARIEPRTQADRADFVFYVEQRARDRFSNSRGFSVAVPHRLDWRFEPDRDLPPSSPLVLWLPDRGVDAADAWPWLDRDLGKAMRVVVVQPPEMVFDGHELQSAWVRSRFGESVARLRIGLERIVEYLRARELCGDRVVVAGSGHGATVALAIARRSRRLGWSTLAFAPHDFDKLADAGTADAPILDEGRRITVFTRRAEVYRRFRALDEETGFETRVVATGDATTSPRGMIDAIREASGLDPGGANDGPAPRLRFADAKSRAWARAWHGRLAAGEVLDFAALRDGDRVLEPALRPELAVPFGRIPKCRDPFGGTTLLIIPAHEDGKGRAAWKAVPGSLRGRARWPVRLAYEKPGDGERSIEDAVTALLRDSPRGLLVVPAEFRASPSRLRGMRDRVLEALGDSTLDVEWRSGLGASFALPSSREE